MVRVRRLGMIDPHMMVVRIGQQRKLIVSPLAAIGTDVIGLGLATTGFFFAKPLWVRVASFFGGMWMLTALTVEILKLQQPDEAEARLYYDV